MRLSVKELCKEKGLTIQDLADKMEMKRESLSRAINGNPTLETLEKIANALGVELWELFADPKKVKHSEGSILCPHCGKEIYIEVTTN